MCCCRLNVRSRSSLLIQPLAELKSLNPKEKEGSSQISLCLRLISPPKYIKIALRERHLELYVLSACLHLSASASLRTYDPVTFKRERKKKLTIPFSADKCGPCVSGRVKMRTMWTDDQGLSSGAELICTTLSFSMFHTCSWLLMPHCHREELTRLPRD